LLTIVSEEEDWHKIRYSFQDGTEGTSLPYDRVGGDKKLRQMLVTVENQQNTRNKISTNNEKEEKKTKSPKHESVVKESKIEKEEEINDDRKIKKKVQNTPDIAQVPV